MYLNINNNRYSCTRRIVKPQSITFIGVEPEPEEISGVIEMYRDDGFLMSEDDTAGYERKGYSGTVLTLTNEPEPLAPPTPPEPAAREKRERAYETERIIEYGDEMITVDEANKLWYQYAAEGRSEVTDELTQKIAEAKNEIRRMYPEENIEEESVDG